MKQPAGRLIINIEGADKSYFLWNGTELYYKKLRSAYNDIKLNKESDYLYFSFFTLCAATLEYSLNYLLTDYCLNHFGHERYKKYAEGYIKLPLPEKLHMCPSIISNGKFRFNDDNKQYIKLKEFITLRNRILHNKEFLKEFEFSLNSDFTSKEIVEFEFQIENNHIETLTKDTCLKFGNALGEFKSNFMTPALNYHFEPNELLTPIT